MLSSLGHSGAMWRNTLCIQIWHQLWVRETCLIQKDKNHGKHIGPRISDSNAQQSLSLRPCDSYLEDDSGWMRNSPRVLCLMTNTLISIALAWEHELLYFESGLCMSIFWGFTPDLTSGVLVPTPSSKIFMSNGNVNKDCFLTVLFFSHLQILRHRNVSLQYLLYVLPEDTDEGMGGREETDGGRSAPRTESPLLHSQHLF